MLVIFCLGVALLSFTRISTWVLTFNAMQFL
jgi:hypothetical protein